MNVDLSTNYLGLRLKNPLVVAACPLTAELDVLRQLEHYGAAAAVLPSLFEEQIEDDAGERDRADYPHATGTFGESLSYFRELQHYNRGPASYLKRLEEAKKAVKIPIIASLNGTRRGEWIRFVRKLESAGADAVELNLYSVVTDFEVSSADIEAQYVRLVEATNREVRIPIAVKLSPYFTALPNVARRLHNAGAKGLVLFNRFIQPDIDPDGLKVSPHLALSTSEEMRLPLRWIALLAGRLPVSLAMTSGVGFGDGIVKALLAGADAVMIASALYRHGIGYLETLLSDLARRIEATDFHSVADMKGVLSQANCADAAVYERANYAKALCSYAGGNGF